MKFCQSIRSSGIAVTSLLPGCVVLFFILGSLTAFFFLGFHASTPRRGPSLIRSIQARNAPATLI